jgi:hypothetical protein
VRNNSIDQITSPTSGHDTHGHHHGAGHAHARLSRSFSSHAPHGHSHSHVSGHSHSATTESGSSSSSEDLAETGHGNGGSRTEALRLVRSGSASGSASSLGERYKPSSPSGVREASAAVMETRREPQPQGMKAAFASVAGLVIHAAADGIAMGASARSDDESLKIVVWLAIMIHKAVSRLLLCDGGATMPCCSAHLHAAIDFPHVLSDSQRHSVSAPSSWRSTSRAPTFDEPCSFSH